MSEALHFGVLILGAGASKRMGRPKLLLPWGETSILGHLARQWKELGARQVALVVREGAGEEKREWVRRGFREEDLIINYRAEEGMFSSVRTAASWSGWENELSSFVIVLGDQPHLQREMLRELVTFSARNAEKICQPSVDGRAKHPVVLPAQEFRELAGAECKTLREFLESRGGQRAFLESEDPGLTLDLDTPEEYVFAVRSFAAEKDKAS